MFLHRACLSFGVLLTCGLVLFVAAGQPKTADPRDKPEDKEVVSSKAVRRPTASSVNFRKELNLPFASLSTLGARIDAARRAPDPVALAHAANELSVAENVSGKKASLVSKELLKESIQLAALRRQVAELRAVEKVAQQVNAEESDVNILKQNIAFAKEQAAAEKRMLDENLQPTWTPRTVVINNYTTQYLDVYVNGNYKTRVGPGGAQAVVIEHRWNPTVLTAYGNEDINTWGPRYIWGRFQKYTWNIN
jgi:hypothetical protein